ncbi:MAG: DUF4384 domain-containing protein [Acidobacteria bacterium]|nr:DUF4384 domain-containing protein [Acidobacteriota bacterium]
MSGNSKTIRARHLPVVCAIAILVGSLIAISASRAQDPPPDEEARRLWDAEFLKKRGAATTSSAPRKNPGYRRAAPKPATIDEKAQGEMVGVTIWRLRSSSAADNQDARLLLTDEESKEKVELTPERVEAETAFAEGDRVRLSIESPRDGFLYVIDREQYADGSMSDPYLIFPTLRSRGGDNAVKAGKVIELPERTAFRLKPMRPDYKGESLTLLITAEPLAEVKVGPRMIKLDNEMVAQWEKRWRVPVERFEMIGGAGKAYTKAEKEAGQEGARLLTQEDEMPQTLYRVITKRGDPLLITVSLRIGK